MVLLQVVIRISEGTDCTSGTSVMYYFCTFCCAADFLYSGRYQLPVSYALAVYNGYCAVLLYRSR